MTLEAIQYDGYTLAILDQLRLPHVVDFVPIRNSQEGWQAIKEMKVRGAPAIAIVAILALAVELRTLLTAGSLPSTCDEIQSFITERLRYLVTSRPTAVNLSEAAGKFEQRIAEYAKQGLGSESIADAYFKDAQKMLEDDLNDNKNIGAHGAKWIIAHASNDKVNVLTHCNTGSLATSGYGTALGVIRSLHSSETLNRAYCTETRPYNQGSRLTAFELVHDEIPATLITDSMAAALLANEEKRISAVVVGADRVAANGDTANKIGTYGLAVLAKYHGVKFVVAAPRTSIDMRTSSGKEIIVEERPAVEVTKIQGRLAGNVGDALQLETVQIAAPGIEVWNPAFDITPAALIDAIVTEVSVVEKGADGRFRLEAVFGN